MDAASDQSCEVSHVNKQECSDLVRDGTHTSEVELTRIGAPSTDDHSRLFAFSDGFELVIVDGLGVTPDLIADDARSRPRIVSPGESSAMYAAALAWEPE
jgi:hypothetical protein